MLIRYFPRVLMRISGGILNKNVARSFGGKPYAFGRSSSRWLREQHGTKEQDRKKYALTSRVMFEHIVFTQGPITLTLSFPVDNCNT
ncbi:MAG: hypothetical protein A4E19_20540 [Nitrospira sp. SG-bin1]|nr:MAG: hypothetical protein A4E19_20540 [Nitrospira sp. SG-bin1]